MLAKETLRRARAEAKEQRAEMEAEREEERKRRAEKRKRKEENVERAQIVQTVRKRKHFVTIRNYESTLSN